MQVAILHMQGLSVQSPWSHGLLLSVLQVSSHLGWGKFATGARRKNKQKNKTKTTNNVEGWKGTLPEDLSIISFNFHWAAHKLPVPPTAGA